MLPSVGGGIRAVISARFEGGLPVIDASDIANDDIAEIFEQVADLLELQEANPFRIRRYRQAAEQLQHMDRSAADLYRKSGEDGLRQLEGVDDTLAGAIAELVDTGRLGLLEQLESELSPTALFERLPGVGEELARRMHDELGVETLEELEEAAYDGRLERIEGIGAKKINGIRNTLAGVLSRSAHRRTYRRGYTTELPPETLQSRQPSLASGHGDDSRGVVADGAVFEYETSAPARPDGRLDRHLLRAPWRRRSVYGLDGDLRRPGGIPRRPQSRMGVS